MAKKKTVSEEYSIGERVAYLRGVREMKQLHLAKIAGVSQSTVAQIENGTKDPSLSTLTKIAKALDCHLAVLFVTEEVHVFDMKKLKKKYKNVDQLNPTLYHAIGRVCAYARDIGFLK